MRRLTVLSPALVLLTISLALADAPTPSDLQQLYKLGDYASVVKGCTDALASGSLTDSADRCKVDLLKGDALLRLGHASEAADAFTAAAKDTEDTRQAFLAKATVILINRSQDLIYTSKTIKSPQSKLTASKPLASMAAGQDSATSVPTVRNKPAVLGPGQFDIVDPLHRSSALAAMWTDERADAEHVIKEKIALKTLASIKDALDRIHQSEPIAVAGGSTEWAQSKKELLAGAARFDANAAIREMNTKLVSISKDQVARRNKQPPKAMPQSQRDQLNKMSESLNQITAALKDLPETLNVDGAAFESQLDQAASLQDRATTVLATD